jgi:cytochrome d ubiquinol oxidase subunit II
MIPLFDLDFLINVWFVLWCVIWAVYLVVDSFSLGTGMLAAFLPKTSNQLMQLVKSVGPFWGGNQVWLILAAGGTFAAFPLIFSKMFTFLYIPMMLLLIAIILRGICLELIYEETKFREIFRYGWAVGSLLITVVLGVAFTNFFRGLKIFLIDGELVHTEIIGLFNVYALLGALLFVLFFLTSGALWIAHKTAGEMSKSAAKWAKYFSIGVAATALLYLIGLFNTDGFAVNYNAYPVFYVIPALAVVAALICIFFTVKKQSKPFFAFLANLGTIFFGAASGVVTLYPNILKSVIDPSNSIGIFEAAASQLTLSIMFIGALVFVPIVIVYQLWTYTQFKEKVQ